MSFLKSKAVSKPVCSFLTLRKDDRTMKQNIRVSANHLSILDDSNQIIEEIVPNAKILPHNLSNQQISQRTLLDASNDILLGHNLSIFFIGASFSGKQQLFDGTKNQSPIIYYFMEKTMSILKKTFGKVQYRMQMSVIISEKNYDCLAQSKHAMLRLKEDKWEGVCSSNSKFVVFDSVEHFKSQLLKGIKQKNKLTLEFKDFYTSYLAIDIVHPDPENQKLTIVSRINIFQIPGVQALSNSHNTIKIKESSPSTKSLLTFSTILNDAGRYPDSIPSFESSTLTFLLKDIIGGNSIIYTYFSFNVSDAEGSLSTAKFLKPFENLNQYPIVNQSRSFGLIKRYRLQAMQGNSKDANVADDQKKQLQSEMLRLQTQEDYKRMIEKYMELKNKYNQALKSKSQAQLQLIKCEEEKLQLGKSLVQMQIQNTKLLQKLQNKDYQNGKKILSAENELANKEMSFQQTKQKLREVTEALNEALQTKRDLEVQFIALKRNFLMQQKQIKQLKEDNQNLSLDLINVSNQNDRLKKQIINGDPLSDNRSRLVKDLENQKLQQIKLQNKEMKDTISYLKVQLERYKKQLLEFQLNSSGMNIARKSLNNFGKDYQRIELENEKLELLSKLKLNTRKIQELQEKVGFYEQENELLQKQNRTLKAQIHQQTQQYRVKLEQFTKNTNQQAIVKQLRDNFSRKDSQNLQKINILKRQISEKKKSIANLKSHIRQLQAMLQEWAPKGVDLPLLKKHQGSQLALQGNQQIIQQLKIRCLKLQQQLRKMKQNTSPAFKQSRISQQMQSLRGSGVSKDIQQLKNEKNKLIQENRRLTILLKDGNKMDLHILKKQNDQFRKQIEGLKGKSSISPSTADQKLLFYEKHIKALEKQRSQLLSRCVVAQQQLKNVLGKVGKAGSHY